MADGGSRDPFDDLVLDDGFVRAARMREDGAQQREIAASQARAARARHEREARRRLRRERRMTWLRMRAGVLIVASIGAGFFVANALGVRADPPVPAWMSGPAAWQVATSAPSPQGRERDEALGLPPVGLRGGPHAFVATQPDSLDPVTYDPCRVIKVVINDRTAPPGTEGLVQQALVDVSVATGLRFVVEGSTDERPHERRESYQRGRYGDRWAPVLVAWSDPEEYPMLEGPVAGVGGSAAHQRSPDDPVMFVSGAVVLDGPQLGELMAFGAEEVRAVILHELGHVVGLDHIEDRYQLMHHTGMPGITTFQDGDRAGLARLGTGPCVDHL